MRIENGTVDALTTMTFTNLMLLVNPKKENAQFLETTVNKLVPYLMSGKGEIIFDFVINGPIDNPRVGMGPKVKYAVGMVAVDEFAEIMKQLQKQ